MDELDDTSEQSSGLSTLKAVFAHQRPIIAVVMLVVFAASSAISFGRTPIYAASASVLVQVPEGSIQGPNMDTEKKLAGSTAVADMVAKKTGGGVVPERLLKSLSISVPISTEILVISYADPNPAVARTRADAFAQAYLAFRQAQFLDRSTATENALEAQISRLTAQLRAVERRASGGGSTATSAEASSLTTLIAGAEQRLATLTPAGTVSAGQVVDPATMPTSPATPDHAVDGALGLLVGFLLGMLVGWVRERGDDRVRDGENAREILGVPVVWTVPPGTLMPATVSRSRKVARNEELIRTVLGRVQAELIVSMAERGVRSLMVTGCGADALPVTAALATSLVRSGMSVIVVSCEAGDGLREQFGVKGEVGLADALAGLDIEDVLQPGAELGLSILPPGSSGAPTAQRILSKKMAPLMEELGRRADLVLIDAGPFARRPEAAAVAFMCDATLIVVGGRAGRTELREVSERLTRHHGVLFGAVFVDRRLRSLQVPQKADGSRPSKPRGAPTMEIAS